MIPDPKPVLILFIKNSFKTKIVFLNLYFRPLSASVQVDKILQYPTREITFFSREIIYLFWETKLGTLQPL